MGLGAILDGHVNEALGTNQSMSEKRMTICKQCPLFKMKSVIGAVCDSKTWYNPETGEISNQRKIGFKHGCGCRLNAKTRLSYAVCPLGKW